MKRIGVLLLLLLPLPVWAQRGISSRDAATIWEWNRNKAIEKRVASSGGLSYHQFKVGAKGRPSHVDAKVVSVIDKDNVIVVLRNTSDRSSWGQAIWLSGVNTTSYTTDQYLGHLDTVVGGAEVTIPRTKTYNSVTGPRTVLYVELVPGTDDASVRKRHEEHVSKLRNNAISAREKAELLMRDRGLSPADEALVRRYIKTKDRRCIVIANKLTTEVMLTPEIKAWLAAEHEYLKTANPRRR